MPASPIQGCSAGGRRPGSRPAARRGLTCSPSASMVCLRAGLWPKPDRRRHAVDRLVALEYRPWQQAMRRQGQRGLLLLRRYLGFAVRERRRHHEPDQQQRFHRGDARLAAAGQEPVAVSDGQPARGLFLRLSRRPPGSRLCRQRQPQLEPEGECDAGRRRQVHPTALHAVRPRLERVHRLSPGRAQYEVLVRRRDRPGSICC